MAPRGPCVAARARKRAALPSLPALLALALLCAPAPALADFLSCAKGTGASVLGASDAGFAERVGRALYPSPAPQFYADVESEDEIKGVINCAREEGVGVCPRSGGHSFVGQSSCEGVVVDMYKMKELEVKGGKAVVEAGSTLGEMFHRILEGTDGGEMVGIGLCPSVGVGGYMLGGGHNPYSGKLGLTCESVEEFEFVTLEGKSVKATRDENEELFWASCGGGGGHFGVLWRFTINTHDAKDFNRNVYFRYEWDIKVAGKVLREWLDYDQNDGDTWIRLEVNAGTGIYGYGVCWAADSVDECEKRLGKEKFFNVEPSARTRHLAIASKSVSEFQAFIGPAGRWAWQKSTLSAEEAFVGTNFDEAGLGLNRLYSSAFWKLKDGEFPSVDVLQKLTTLCSAVDKGVLAFSLCQWNPWEGKQREVTGDNAFAHRRLDVFTELIGEAQKSNVQGGLNELKRIEATMKELAGEYYAGVYVSYPEGPHLNLKQEDYSYLYWGQSLPRLAALKKQMDPNGIFKQIQPMPIGKLACPAEMDLSGDGPEFSLAIGSGYADGQAPDMHLAFALGDGCSVDSASGAQVEKVDATGPGTVFNAVTESDKPFTVKVDGGESCKPELVAINSIVCNDEYELGVNKAKSSDNGESSSGDGSSSKGGMGTGAVAGIAAAATVGVLGAIVIGFCCCCNRQRWRKGKHMSGDV